MAEPRITSKMAVLVGFVVAAVTAFSALILVPSRFEGLKQAALDAVLTMSVPLLGTNEPDLRLIVVDIDSQSLKSGSWPWPRDQMARLVDEIGRRGAAVIGIDVLFAEPDSQSPAALARRLGELAGRAELLSWAESLTDGDKLLANALDRVPVALGFLLDQSPSEPLPPAPIVHRGGPIFEDLWSGAGAVGPPRQLRNRAGGLGVLALPGDADGVVRRVPLFVSAGSAVHPGLALEVVRLSQSVSTYLIDAPPPAVTIGAVRRPLPSDGLLRLVPIPAEQSAITMVSAADLLSGKAQTDFRGAIVLIGSSAPETGGLRATASDPQSPSVIIHANAILQFMRGIVPRPPPHDKLIEATLAFVVVSLAIGAATRMRPFIGALVTSGVIVAVWFGPILTMVAADWVIDPLLPSILGVAAATSSSINVFAQTYRREATIRRRFAQHLTPQVVDKIIQNPSLLKLTGERREVTALFTDIESFTAMTDRATPEDLVKALDDYFEGVAKIIVAHGGMVDKVVGDAVHAIFNAPLDQRDHPRHALESAVAIRDWAEAWRRSPLPAGIGFGRTRIGIETGDAIVGDIGISSKLDYTAHGNAVNTAARLQSINKELGSTICVGQTTAHRCNIGLLRPLGEIELRGLSRSMRVYEPWPSEIDPAWRERYLAADLIASDNKAAAAAMFEVLAGERPDDAVPRLRAERLCTHRPE